MRFSVVIMVIVLAITPSCKKNLNFEFEQQSSYPGISIRGLSIVNDSVVWVSGSKGRFARTIDGGKNWSWDSIEGATNMDFRDIQAFSEKTAIVISAGNPAKLFKTIDAGKSWQEKYSDTTAGVFFDAMDFWDDSSGVALSDPLKDGCLIIETHDGGETWKRIPVANLPEIKSGEAHFAASGTCLVTTYKTGICFVSGGSAARVFISADRGKSWKVSNSPILCGKLSQGIFSVAVFNEKMACIVGGDYENPEIAKNTVAYTNSGGKNWILAETFPPKGFNSCVRYYPGNRGSYLVATGTEGSHVSKDSGKTWQLLDTVPFHTLDFEKEGKCGWAAGSDGRIAKIKINRMD